MKCRGNLFVLVLLVAAPVSLSQSVPRVSTVDTAHREATVDQPQLHQMWGVDILMSNDGFGFGGFYRRDYTPDLSGFLSFSISESKDDREVERFDYFGRSFTPGKLRRFLVMPLMVGVQYRLFREEITESFRPYVNAGAGPTMIYSSPYTEVATAADGTIKVSQVEFFRSLGKGQPSYTVGAFVGVGANFGNEKANVFGLNIRYYFTYLFGEGINSLYEYNGSEFRVVANKKEFGGFFITLNIGMAY